MEYEKQIREFEIKLKKAEKLLFLSNFFKSKKIILSTLEEIAYANKLLSISMLKFHHIKGNIIISKDPLENKKILNEKIGKLWEIEEELEELSKLMKINSEHTKSPTEFLRKNKVIILDENQNIYSIDTKLLKENLNHLKKIKEVFKVKITG